MPAPNPAIGDTIRCRAVATVNGQWGMMTSAWRVATVSGAGRSLVLCAVDWLTIVQFYWPPVLSQSAFVGGVQLDLYGLLDGHAVESAKQLDGVTSGTKPTAMVPQQVAAVVAKETGFAGRKFRGRVYFPFLGDDALTTNGELRSAEIPHFQTAVNGIFGAQNFASGLNGILVAPVLMHKTPINLPVAFTDIDGFLTTGKLGTQRRRGDYGRPNGPF